MSYIYNIKRIKESKMKETIYKCDICKKPIYDISVSFGTGILKHKAIVAMTKIPIVSEFKTDYNICLQCLVNEYNECHSEDKIKGE
jgi:hypothetical protein